MNSARLLYFSACWIRLSFVFRLE